MKSKSEATKKAQVKKDLQIIEEKFVNGSQSIEMIGLYRLKGLKLKVHIDRDSYDFQSSATVLVWKESDLKWNIVASVHHNDMKVCHGWLNGHSVFYQTKRDALTDHDRMLFKLDKDKLISLANEILF